MIRALRGTTAPAAGAFSAAQIDDDRIDGATATSEAAAILRTIENQRQEARGMVLSSVRWEWRRRSIWA
jgi:hypothetical protein